MTLLKRNKNRNGNGELFPTLTNDFFNNRFLNPSLFFDDLNNGLQVPPANFVETDNEYKIELCVPGLKREDFNVEVENGDLVVSSESKQEEKEEKDNYWRREFSYRSFSRRFPLPENTADDKINAKYDNGMLNIIIPKKEVSVSKPKKQIKVS